MSGNSGSQGASGFNTPALPGFNVTWDRHAGVWVARSQTLDATLRGRNQAELDQARDHLALRLGEELQQIVRKPPDT